MKRKISLILSAAMLAASVSPVFAITSLNDVRGHWGEKAINNLIYSGIVNGYPDGSFKPDNKINADEFIVLVLKAVGYEAEESGTDYWAQGYINQAIQKGVLKSGYIDEFARPVTREEMCMLITNAFSVEEEENIFAATDADEVDEKYSEYVKKAYNAKIVTGYEDGSFKPKEGLTRAEACQVIRAAQNYDPDAKLAYEHKEYNIIDATQKEESPWKFYIANSGDNYRDKYTEVGVYTSEDKTVRVSADGGGGRPNIYWDETTAKDEGVYVYVERDSSTASNKGNMIVEFTAPKGGNYIFNFECKNIGSDVVGGDGGSANMTFYGKNDALDATSVGSVSIPVSSRDAQIVSISKNVKLKRGQSVALRFGANYDGYGDCFQVKYNVETTEKEGQLYVNNGIKSYLAQPPEEKQLSAAPYHEGMVWVAADGGWATSEWAEEVVEILEKYIPDLGVVLLTSNPEVNPKADYYAKKGIPTFIQNFGAGSVYQYFSETDAWEYNWNGVAATPDSGFTLANTGHSSALPHESVWEYTERMNQSAIRTGYGGYGYPDYVWDWGMGRGVAGYNPQTLAAFRKDLKGEDEGLLLGFGGEEPRKWYFEDFAKYYTGNMLTPEDVGIESWDDYTPLTYNEYLQNKDKDHTQNNLLMDLLITYEWLRLAQHMCDVADEEGGMTQVLTNPEDAANAGDFLFLSSLEKLEMSTAEYFGDTEYLDGAYYRLNYLTSKKSDGNSPGIVLECGGGGNAGSYYDNSIAYAVAYELKAATEASHLETDFMVQGSTSVSNNSNNKYFKDRYQAVMSYARGFIDAQEDDVKRVGSDFVSVTSRKVNRPWGDEWHVWEWLLDWKGSPDPLLSQNGYIFDGIGEDGVFDIEKGQEIIVYSPDRPTQYHFDYIIDCVRNGDFKKILTNGASIERIIDNKYNQKDMKDVYPEYAFEMKENVSLSGNVTDKDGNVLAENIEIESTNLYENKDYETIISVGETPVLVKKSVGSGDVYVYCLDPNENVNYYVSKACYDYMLENAGIKKQFETIEASGELLDEYTDWGTVASMGHFAEGASVRLYENGDLKVVGIQNPLSRNMVGKDDMQEKKIIAYELKNAKTTVKSRLEPNTEYHYVALPSGQKGIAVSDEEGFTELSFENTGHEIFYCLPASTENDVKLSEIAARLLIWEDSLSYAGNIAIADTAAPATTISVEGNCSDDIYTGAVKVTLNAVDDAHGSGVVKLEYAIDDGSFATATNRSVVNGGYINKTLTLTGSGTHTVSYRATDARGNTEQLGIITINIK